jgi:hypothetical protein
MEAINCFPVHDWSRPTAGHKKRLTALRTRHQRVVVPHDGNGSTNQNRATDRPERVSLNLTATLPGRGWDPSKQTIFEGFWSRRSDSNRGPADYEMARSAPSAGFHRGCCHHCCQVRCQRPTARSNAFARCAFRRRGHACKPALSGERRNALASPARFGADAGLSQKRRARVPEIVDSRIGR